MIKKFRLYILIIGIVTIFGCFSFSASAADFRKIPIRVGEKTVDGLLIEETTFAPLEYLTLALGADSVSWSAKTRIVTIEIRGMTIETKHGANYLEANGRCFYTALPCRTIDGNLYVPIRLIAKAFGADVVWNGDTYTVDFVDHGDVCVPGSTYYAKDAVLWLSRIIYAESVGEPFLGKLAVASVVMNRVEDSAFPNTIYGVIFDTKYGVQFTPTANGRIYNDADDECRRVAKMVLEGATVNEDVLYFINRSIATSLWVHNNRPFAFQIGEHSFYY